MLRSFLAGSQLHATLTGGAGGSSMFQLSVQSHPTLVGSSRQQQAGTIIGLAAAATSTAITTAAPIDVDATNINAFLDLVPNPYFDEEEESTIHSRMISENVAMVKTVTKREMCLFCTMIQSIQK